MATYYPCPESANTLCKLCNTVQSNPSCCTSASSKNNSNQQKGCDTYCNSGCNSVCNSIQTICKLHDQYIKNHPDVGAYPGLSRDIVGGPEGDIISQIWTVEYWNSLINQLNAAERVGRAVKQGNNKSAKTATSTAPITAEHYNGLRDKICNFNTSYEKVAKNEVITAAKANAIRNGYNSAKFNSNVCDVCNAGDQSIHAGCNCNCSCACSCPCGCSCPCSCSCSCSCSCQCNNPAPAPKA